MVSQLRPDEPRQVCLTVNPLSSALPHPEVSAGAVSDPAALSFLAAIVCQPVTRTTATANNRAKTFAENKTKKKATDQAQERAGKRAR